MRSPWKIVRLVGYVALVAGAAVAWHAYRTKGNEQKLVEAARICRISAEKGDAKAQAVLGHMYSHGEGVPQDYAEAVRWYRKGADQGDARAENGLAYMYLHGLAVSRDYSEAVVWYRKGADQGYMKAESGLAWMYSYGLGVPQDKVEAALWCRKAAEQGYAIAQSNLGYSYANGWGVTRDRAEAIRWYRKAADQGDEYALRALSVPLTRFTGVALFVEFLVSLWLTGLLSYSPLVLRQRLRHFQQRVLTGTGVLGVFVVGLKLYGYTHYKLRCLHCGINGFTSIKWILTAVWIALLVYVLLQGKKSALRQDGIDSADIDSIGQGAAEP